VTFNLHRAAYFGIRWAFLGFIISVVVIVIATLIVGRPPRDVGQIPFGIASLSAMICIVWEAFRTKPPE
jgi:hypothetical protein